MCSSHTYVFYHLFSIFLQKKQTIYFLYAPEYGVTPVMFCHLKQSNVVG